MFLKKLEKYVKGRNKHYDLLDCIQIEVYFKQFISPLL